MMVAQSLVIVSVLLGQLVGLGADQRAHFWYDPSNWGLGWQLCSMNRLSQKSVDPAYEPDELPAWKVAFTEEELRAKLTEDEYWVTQHKGTEKAWSDRYMNLKNKDGTFSCVVCGAELFNTDKKYESSCGWPSFTDIAKKENVLRLVDRSRNELRTEVVCAQCGAHLGHVFDDGPEDSDTGLRYCINSVAIDFTAQ